MALHAQNWHTRALAPLVHLRTKVRAAQKGADGQPEIIPEQAELIRMIYTSYLHGDSLQTIKSKVEAGGYKTVPADASSQLQDARCRHSPKLLQLRVDARAHQNGKT